MSRIKPGDLCVVTGCRFLATSNNIGRVVTAICFDGNNWVCAGENLITRHGTLIDKMDFLEHHLMPLNPDSTITTETTESDEVAA